MFSSRIECYTWKYEVNIYFYNSEIQLIDNYRKKMIIAWYSQFLFILFSRVTDNTELNSAIDKYCGTYKDHCVEQQQHSQQQRRQQQYSQQQRRRWK